MPIPEKVKVLADFLFAVKCLDIEADTALKMLLLPAATLEEYEGCRRAAIDHIKGLRANIVTAERASEKLVEQLRAIRGA